MAERRARGVLLVGNFLSANNGSRGVCEDLAVRLANMGWRVVTTSSKPYRVHRLLDMLGTIWRKRHEYDVVQVDVYSGLAFGWAEAVCFLLRLLKKPYVLILRGGDLPSFGNRWPIRVKRLLKSAATVVAPSGYLQEKMSHFRRDIVLQPNPLDLSLYEFRQRMTPKPRLVWLRAFHQTYNPSLALKTLSLLAADFPGIHLKMAGPDKGDGSLQRARDLATSLKVSDQITLIEGVPKSVVPACLNDGDIFINTTNVDNTPVSVMEAMACGLCVVTTNVGGIPYLVENETDGLLVPPSDAGAMAQAVRRILTEEGLARRLSHNARRKAEQFDWSVILPQWDTLFDSVSGAADGR